MQSQTFHSHFHFHIRAEHSALFLIGINEYLLEWTPERSW